MAMRPPLISVIGATGTGKSQLAVELALALNGEVINADAMQLYQGLPIITNKITASERKGVPHHLLGVLDTTRDVWQVGRFVREAEMTIDEIRARGRIPILAGGTHYYVQTLLFPHDPEDRDGADEFQLPDVADGLAEKYPILDAPTPELYEALKAVDPLMASRWHPNDRRKIRRSLEIYYSTDCRTTASEVYAAQRASRSKATAAAEETSRSKHNNLIFWVHAETEILRARLDGRVGKMMESGMWREIEEMEVLYNSLGRENVDLNSGIWQSIGFKEFLPYLDLRNSCGRCGGGGGAMREDEHTEKTKDRAIEDMKTATRQYARSQTRWIRIKFLHALAANGGTGNLFLLDSTDSARYDDIVVKPGIQIAKDFLAYKPLPDPLTFSALARENLTPKRDYDISQRPDLWGQRTCEICNIISTNEPEWEKHMKSSKHKKKVASVRKMKEVREFLRRREREREEAAQKEGKAERWYQT